MHRRYNTRDHSFTRCEQMHPLHCYRKQKQRKVLTYHRPTQGGRRGDPSYLLCFRFFKGSTSYEDCLEQQISVGFVSITSLEFQVIRGSYHLTYPLLIREFRQ